jgi:hypothetical protein
MSPLFQGDAKILPLEGKRSSDMFAANIPEEYVQLLLPYASIHGWQQDHVYILSQHIQLGPFSLWVHDIASYREQVICPFVPFPLYTLHFLFESNLKVTMPRSSPFLLYEDRCNLFYLESGLSYLPLEAGSKTVSFHINILPDHMPQLVRSYPLSQQLREKPSSTQVINKQPYAINATSRMLITKILTCRYLQHNASLYLHRCCADLFNIFCRQHAIEGQPAFVEDVIDADVYHHISEYLITHIHVHHDIHMLCLMFNMTAARLEKGFLNAFSLSIEEYIHMLKMMTVFELITKNEHPLSSIAYAVAMETNDMINQVEKYYQFKVSAQGN